MLSMFKANMFLETPVVLKRKRFQEEFTFRGGGRENDVMLINTPRFTLDEITERKDRDK